MAAVWLPEPQKEFFAQDEVTTASLANVFNQAFYKTDLEKDGTLSVRTDDGFWVFLSVFGRFLMFMSGYRIKESTPLESRHALVNKMNDEMHFVRFSIRQSQEDVLVADCYLPIEEGVALSQVVRTFKLFAQIVSHAIRTCDEDDIIT